MEDDLKVLMQTVDEHSNVLPEGAYLEICQRLRNLFMKKERARASTIFNYEEPIVSLNAPAMRNEVDQYFEHLYFTNAVVNEIEFLKHCIEYLNSLKMECAPIQRIGKYTKMHCVQHFAGIHNIRLNEYSPQSLRKYCEANAILIGKSGEEDFDKAFARICHGYKVIENRFRKKFLENVEAKIEQTENLIRELCHTIE